MHFISKHLHIFKKFYKLYKDASECKDFKLKKIL